MLRLQLPVGFPDVVVEMLTPDALRRLAGTLLWDRLCEKGTWRTLNQKVLATLMEEPLESLVAYVGDSQRALESRVDVIEERLTTENDLLSSFEEFAVAKNLQNWRLLASLFAPAP
eukprot:TRINITY_DN29992_c0_g1_i1.p1 TRINITY_DN29992_c0_g1~~TRINITY_DN29992_c0_g1_i1.p1  ORF type:complete len:116 (-),score=23.81 TRINITY_DN29992_c0_g1_i1:82-429(-)